jgi:ATP/maltotriose-dependent transcriptional regulator MalT
MTRGDGDPGLDALRDLVVRQEWQAALDAATALSIAPDAPDAVRAEADRADLRADAAWWLGRLDECIVAREDAHQRYEALGDHERAGQCAVWLWEHHAISARPAIANAWLRRARRSLEDGPEGPALGALLLREAEVAHGQGDLVAAVERATQVIALARRLGSADLEGEALQTKGRVLIEAGDLDDGMGHLDEAMLLAVQGRLGPYSTGKVYCSLISACEDVGDLDRAAEWTEATLTWSQRHPFAIFPGICRVHRAVVLKRRGSLVEAEREALQASDELRGSHLGNVAAAHAEVGDIRRRLGDLDRAEEAFGRAQEMGRTCGELALLRLAQGRIDAAGTVIAGCLEEARTSRLARSRLLPVQVHVAAAAGDLETADAAMAELDAIADAFGTPLLRATVASTRGRLHLAHGDAAAAAADLADAVDAWAELDVPYELATARTLLGQARREVGDDKGAAAAFAAAPELFERNGARHDARLVLDDGRPARPDGLTEREVEVLRLVAAGRSNSDIADQLHLSVKTVSRHLSNIFTKIGVTSRSAATAYAFAHALVDPPR